MTAPRGSEVSRPYRPSNGTEGLIFMDRFCDRCEKDAKYRETQHGRDGCQILAAAFFNEPADPEYPKEWQEDDDGRPSCSAFEEELTEEARARRVELEEMAKRGQGDLFGEGRGGVEE